MNWPACTAIGSVFVLSCSGCAWLGLGGDDELTLAKVAARTVTCVKGEDCSSKWQKARKWVQAHTELGFRQATDVLLTTESPQAGDPMSAFEIVKTPNSDGTYTITFDSYCGDEKVCDPSALQHKADFVRDLLDSP